MFSLERSLCKQLVELKENYNLMGIKAEFEAEGASFRDLVRLRRITSAVGVKLYLKIGGVEAVRDIKDSAEIHVDGLIAPMVESKFGVYKFVNACHEIYGNETPELTINVETKNAILQIDEILDYAAGKIENVTIGRSDLSLAYFDPNIKPDSSFIFQILNEVGKKVKQRNMTLTVGGSVSANTIKKMQNYTELKELIHKMETRKIMLPTSTMLENKEAIKESLKFEELYILSKKEFSDMNISSEIKRLTELKRRING